MLGKSEKEGREKGSREKREGSRPSVGTPNNSGGGFMFGGKAAFPLADLNFDREQDVIQFQAEKKAEKKKNALTGLDEGLRLK